MKRIRWSEATCVNTIISGIQYLRSERACIRSNHRIDCHEHTRLNAVWICGWHCWNYFFKRRKNIGPHCWVYTVSLAKEVCRSSCCSTSLYNFYPYCFLWLYPRVDEKLPQCTCEGYKRIWWRQQGSAWLFIQIECGGQAKDVIGDVVHARSVQVFKWTSNCCRNWNSVWW